MEKITDDEKKLWVLLKAKTDFLGDEDRCGIGLMMRYFNKTKEMCDWLTKNPNATRDEIYDKAEEFAGIEPLTDEDIENLTEDDYILNDEDDEQAKNGNRQVITKEIDELIITMRDMGFDKTQATGLLLLSSQENFVEELLEWLKEHPEATEEEAYIFADTLY